MTKLKMYNNLIQLKYYGQYLLRIQLSLLLLSNRSIHLGLHKQTNGC